MWNHHISINDGHEYKEIQATNRKKMINQSKLLLHGSEILVKII